MSHPRHLNVATLRLYNHGHQSAIMIGMYVSLIAIVAFGFLGGFALLPCLAGQSILVGPDYLAIWYPFMEFTQRALRTYRELPMWLPSIFGGIPFQESLVPSLLYPSDILAWLFQISPVTFYAWDAWAHLAIAGFGVYLLATIGGASPLPAICAGTAYMLGGSMTATIAAGTVVFTRGAAILPWFLVSLTRAIAKPGLIPWLFVAMTFALLPLTASYQLAAYGILVALIFVIAQWRNPAPTLLWLLLSLIFAGALAAIVLLPGIRYYLLSYRAVSSDAWWHIDAYSLSSIVALVIPQQLQPAETKYLGLLVVLLAALALLVRLRFVWTWTLIGVISLLFALGPQTPFGGVMAVIPFMASFRAHDHWLIVLQLAVSIMAAMGIEYLGRYLPGRFRTPVFGLILFIIGADLLRQAPSLCHTVPAGIYISQRALLGRSINRLIPNSRIPFRIMSEEPHFVMNMRIPLGYEWAGGYHGAPLAWFQSFYAGAFEHPNSSRILAWMNARYLIVHRVTGRAGIIPMSPITDTGAGTLWLCENPFWLPRAFFARQLKYVPNDGAALDALSLDTPSDRIIYTTENLPPDSLASGTVNSLEISPNHIRADVTSSGHAMIFFSEAYYPAWTAFVDGVRTPIHRLNVMFRGIFLEKGHHIIVMSYDSLPFRLGMIVTLISSLLAIALGIVTFLSSRRP